MGFGSELTLEAHGDEGGAGGVEVDGEVGGGGVARNLGVRDGENAGMKQDPTTGGTG